MSSEFNDYLNEMCQAYTDVVTRASCESTCQSAVAEERRDKIATCFETFSTNNPLPDVAGAAEEEEKKRRSDNSN